MVTRRNFLAYTSFSMALAALGLTPEALAAQRLKLGKVSAFSFEWLVQLAETQAKSPFIPLKRCPKISWPT